MTLIVAIRCSSGVVFASDSQITVHDIRYSGAKIHRLGSAILWGASGELAVAQRVEEELENFPPPHDLRTLRDSLTEVVRAAAEALIKMDFRSQFLASNPAALLNLHSADFLFVGMDAGKPAILHISLNGTPEWVRAPFAATGNGAPFAHALFHKYSARELSVEKGLILAYKIIEEAIAVGSYGLGSPIHVWVVENGAAREVRDQDLAALEDLARVLREREVDLLLSPGEPNTPDLQAVAGKPAATSSPPRSS